jgi:hypothetical protein
MLEKFFSWTSRKKGKEGEGDPAIVFGRYSDNNKPVEKVEKWNQSEVLFKEKKFHESLSAFFDYLCDDTAENVKHERHGTEGKFMFYQGSKIVRGFYNSEVLEAEVALASMPQPSVPVMRRLLEMNFSLYYTRYAIATEKLCMMFDSDIETANPSKLYYGLKEMAIKADKQDDLLVQDFTSLLPVDVEHITQIPEKEKEIKYKYMQQWIRETLDLIEHVDADKFSGGVAYLLLALAYRIDFLIVPEGKLLLNIEKIVEIYFKKDDRPVSEKNQDMIEEFMKLQARTQADIFPHLFRSRYTFSIVMPQNHKMVADAIYNANQNIGWYKDNRRHDMAARISEYGFAYCQYSYSLPRPVTDFFQLFMMVNYPEYFTELGFKSLYYNKATNEFNKEAIFETVHEIEDAWKPKYPSMKIREDKLKFDDITSFNQTFTCEIEFLNLDTK